MSKHNRDRILDMIYQSHIYLQKLESTPRDFGTGELLYASDIHTLVAVDQSPGCNLTQLAGMLCISKAAVSKFVAKLVKKGYLVKGRRIDNDREVIFHLTKKGQAAVAGHDKFEAETFGPLLEIESALSDQEHQVIKGYFQKIGEVVSE
jgi:DNA-binding MarR family transcriptional regulator